MKNKTHRRKTRRNRKNRITKGGGEGELKCKEGYHIPFRGATSRICIPNMVSDNKKNPMIDNPLLNIDAQKRGLMVPKKTQSAVQTRITFGIPFKQKQQTQRISLAPATTAKKSNTFTTNVVPKKPSDKYVELEDYDDFNFTSDNYLNLDNWIKKENIIVRENNKLITNLEKNNIGVDEDDKENLKKLLTEKKEKYLELEEKTGWKFKNQKLLEEFEEELLEEFKKLKSEKSEKIKIYKNKIDELNELKKNKDNIKYKNEINELKKNKDNIKYKNEINEIIKKIDEIKKGLINKENEIKEFSEIVSNFNIIMDDINFINNNKLFNKYQYVNVEKEETI